MSYGWDDYEPAPLEFFHGRLMDLFHEFRKDKVGTSTCVVIDGIDIGNLIARAKIETYKKYSKHLRQDAIKKTDM